MDNKKIILLVAIVIFLSGCFKVTVKETIHASGKSDIVMIIRPLNASQQLAQGGKDPCEGLTSTSGDWTDTSCKYDGEKITLTGKIENRENNGLTIEGDTYRLDILKSSGGFDIKSDQSGQKMSASDKETLRELKKQGVVYDYIVKMPGKVTDQKGGVIQSDGSVKYDLLDMPEDAYIESSTVDGLFQGGCCCIPLLGFIIAGVGTILSKCTP